jgi:hypothetical protein
MQTKTTSNSPRLGVTLALSILGLVLVVDLGLRVIDQRLSGNLAHIQQIPDIVRGAAATDKPALMVLGNSLTNNGVESAVIEASLPNFAVAKVTPDGSNFWDWQCILKHQVVGEGEGAFKTVVVGYAWHLLSDQTEPNASRLGGLFCRWSDLLQPSELGLSHSSDIGEFITARVLRVYALREILRNRFFKRVIPHYEQYTQAANRAAQAGAPQTADEMRYTYGRVNLLAAQLKAEGTRLIVIAMPVQNDYPIDPELQELAQQGALTIYDYRSVEGINATSFEDAMHLNENGQAILSARLAAMLAADIATDDKAAP